LTFKKISSSYLLDITKKRKLAIHCMVDQYQGLIFDCDGTLTDSMPWHFLAWQRTMSRHGIDFPESRFYELAGVPTAKIIDLLGRECDVKLDVKAVTVERDEAFELLAGNVKPVKPVLEVASRMKGRVPMAVASGSVRKSVEQQLDSLGIRNWFDAVVCAEDTKKHKPEPDVFLEAARRIGVPAVQCCVYEDGDLGIQAAQSAGMDVVDVRPMIADWKSEAATSDENVWSENH